MKISVVFGTRPEAIKLAPVIVALRRQRAMTCRVCVTAQHRELLDQVLAAFAIRPAADLNLMRKDQTAGDFTVRALKALDRYLAREKPDLLLVQGDTTTSFCAALAAFYRRIPVGHVEAGLRTWDMDAPWPEEANRVLTSRLASMHFAPTPENKRNLIREGIPARRIFVTGNTVLDALGFALKKIRNAPPRIHGLPTPLQPGQAGPRIILITCHRRENLGAGLDNICQAVAELARKFPDAHFVYPVHLNPKIRVPVYRSLGRPAAPSNVHLIAPPPYLSFVALMDRAYCILTDSGGIQEEAPSLGKPVLVMRKTTERPEAVKSGGVRITGATRRRIVQDVTRLLTDASLYRRMARARNPYGDAKTAPRIARIIKNSFKRP